jgi:hypothetical protein
MDDRTRIVALVNVIVILVGTILAVVKVQEIGEVGVSLIASGIVALFYFLYPKGDAEQMLHEITKNGLAKTYVGRSLPDEYSSLIERAKKKIDILGFGLNSFREDNGELIPKKCLEGVEVRFLVIDPESEVFKMKSQEEDENRVFWQKEPHKKLVQYVTETNNLIESSGKGKKIQMKYYRATPSTMIFRIDDTMFVGPYLYKRCNRNVCTFRLEKGELFNQFEEHFEKVWADPKVSRDPFK